MAAFQRRRTDREDHPERTDRAAPINLVEVAMDDALLDRLAARATTAGRDALSSGLSEGGIRGDRVPGVRDPRGCVGDGALPDALAAWQDRLRIWKLPDPPAVHDAAAAIAAAPPRYRSLRPVLAVAVGICALLFSSTIVGARSARPGDALWPVTRVVWANQADSAMANQAAHAALGRARAALAADRPNDAVNALLAASARIPQVNGAPEQAAIRSDLDELWVSVAAVDPTAAAARPGDAGVTAAGEQAGGPLAPSGAADHEPAAASGAPVGAPPLTDSTTSARPSTAGAPSRAAGSGTAAGIATGAAAGTAAGTSTAAGTATGTATDPATSTPTDPATTTGTSGSEGPSSGTSSNATGSATSAPTTGTTSGAPSGTGSGAPWGTTPGTTPATSPVPTSAPPTASAAAAPATTSAVGGSAPSSPAGPAIASARVPGPMSPDWVSPGWMSPGWMPAVPTAPGPRSTTTAEAPAAASAPAPQMTTTAPAPPAVP